MYFIIDVVVLTKMPHLVAGLLAVHYEAYSQATEPNHFHSATKVPAIVVLPPSLLVELSSLSMDR